MQWLAKEIALKVICNISRLTYNCSFVFLSPQSSLEEGQYHLSETLVKCFHILPKCCMSSSYDLLIDCKMSSLGSATVMQ